MNQAKRWILLLLNCLVTLCIGSLYAWSAFSGPLAQHLSVISGQEITSLAIVFTIANAVGPITMISGGYVNDKLGPRNVLLLGSLLFGGGMIATGLATSTPIVILSYGLGVGLGCGMIYGITTATAVKCFPERSGFAGGLITACYGGSSIIMPPIAAALTAQYSIGTAFQLIGAVMLVMICASAFVIGKLSSGINSNAQVASVSTGKDYPYYEMIKQPSFYLMLLTLMCGAFAGLMVISQASQIAQKMMGFPLPTATIVVSVLALFNTLGRLVSGILSDKLGPPATLRISFIISLAANVLLYFCQPGSTVFFFIALCVIGFCFGSIMGIFPGFTARQFGRKNNSMNYGIMFIGFALAGLFGPMIMNAIFDSTARYQPAFLVSAALAVVGFTLISVFSKRQGRS